MSAVPRRRPFLPFLHLLPALVVVPLLLGAAADARADDDDSLKIQFSGQIQTDLRFRAENKSIGDFYNRITLPAGVERNQNMLRMKMNATYGRFAGVADVDFVVNGFTGKLQGIGDLSKVEDVQPYRFDVNSLYLEAKNLFTKGLDLRAGQQLVLWGVGDQFNPTNNLNPDDLRDPLLFGKQAGNFMVKLDYWLSDSWSVTGVLVPIFKPALLPNTAALGLGAVDRLPFTSRFVRNRIEAESGFGGSQSIGYPTTVSKVTPVMPDPTFENMQFAYRLAGTIFEQDVALSYYNGRTDFPQPIQNFTHQTKFASPQCDPDNRGRCINGLLETDVTLAFPKMHVYGVNVTGEIPMTWLAKALHGIGYRFEGALIVPQRTTIQLVQTAIDFGIVKQPAGDYAYVDGKRPAVVESTPFLKWVVGLDYTLGSHVYANAQWVHGLMDEFGSGVAVRQSSVVGTDSNVLSKCVLPRDGTVCAKEMTRPRIGDYLAIGVDLKFLNDQALMRIFAILDLAGYTEESWDDNTGKRVQVHHGPFSADGYSVDIYPDFNYNFNNGLELGAGALVQLGKTYTKFGDPAAGGSLVFTHGRFSF